MIADARAALETLDNLAPSIKDRVIQWLRAQDSIDVSIGQFVGLIGANESDGERVAEAFVAKGIFTKSEDRQCSREDCNALLSSQSLEEGRCGRCDRDLVEFPPRAVVRYHLERQRSRDVGWLIALHGIRTEGQWQQELQWLVDREFRHTIPFRNWKYGRILYSAMLPPLQRGIVTRFVEDVRKSERQLVNVLSPGPAPAPDVVAHSFGTWVVANALTANPGLRLGHVVLVGSIIPRDWDWQRVFNRSQVSGVLNYCGDRDLPVLLAKRFIPKAGASGRKGFTRRHPRLLNVLYPGGTHSSAFADPQLLMAFEDVWKPFFADRWDDIDRQRHRVL